MALELVAPAPADAAEPSLPPRGGHAEAMPARGGKAELVEPIGRLADWVCIHRREGAWNDTADPYWGGLQFDRTFMRTYGRDMLAKYGGRLADAWTPRDQMVVAERARKTRGYYPWPNTARACGLI